MQYKSSKKSNFKVTLKAVMSEGASGGGMTWGWGKAEIPGVTSPRSEVGQKAEGRITIGLKINNIFGGEVAGT